MIMIKTPLRFCVMYEGLKISSLSIQNSTRSEIIVGDKGDHKD